MCIRDRGNPHQTKLKPDEQYLHFSLWSLFSAPLLIGCDLEKMDDFTLSLLTNNEVIAVNQDPLGKQATCAYSIGELRIYVKELEEDVYKRQAPNNLTDAPEWAIGFMKEVPTTWDEVRFIDGYPGKYVVMARRHGDKWYIAGVNAQKETVKLKIALPMFMPGNQVRVFSDNEELQGNVKQVKVNKKQELQLTMPCNGGILIVE